MNEEKIKSVKERAIKASKQVADEKIEELKVSFVKFLEDKEKAVSNQNENDLAKDIKSAAFSREGLEVKPEEQDVIRKVFNEVANQTKGMIRAKLTEITKKVRETLEIKKKAGTF